MDNFAMTLTVSRFGYSDQEIPHGASLSYTLHESDTSEWTFTAENDSRTLNPENSGTWSGWLDDLTYRSDGVTYAKTLAISGTLDGTPWTLPTGVPTRYGYGLEPIGTSYDAFQWQGRGIAAKLYNPDQSMDPIHSTIGGGEVYVQTALSGIFTNYGVTGTVTAVSPNYLVARMPRSQSAPIEWIRQLTEATQAAWYESGSTVVFFQPNLTATPFRTYSTSGTTPTTGLDMRVTVERSWAQIVNQLVVQRADDNGGVLARVTGTTFTGSGGQGRYSATLSSAIPYGKLHWKRLAERNGLLSDFYIYGVGQHPPSLPISVRELRGANPGTIAGTNTDYVEFTFGAATWTPVGDTSGQFDIQFRGDNTGGVYSDTTTSLIINDVSSQQNGLGIRKQTIGPNPCISDATTLQTWGERVLARLAKRQWKATIEVPFDPFIRPGHTVDLTDAQFSTTRRLYVQQVAHQIGNGGWRSRRTTLTAVCYET